MSIVDRVKNILLSPKTEWPVIAAEPATTGSLFTYAAILMLLPLISTVLFSGVLGFGMFGTGMIGGILLIGAVTYALGLALLYVMALIVDAVAPSFDGQKALIQSLKLLVYGATPSWVAGIVAGIPVLGALVALGAGIYAIYLLYLGSGPVKLVPEAKQVGFTAVTVIIYIIVNIVIVGLIVGALTAAIMGAAGLAGMAGAGI